MSKKSERIGMLIAVKDGLGAIEFDAENQDTEQLKSNMVILQKKIVSILALDGIKPIRADGKVN